MELALSPPRPVSSVRWVLAIAGVGVFFTGLDTYGSAAWSTPEPVYLILAFIGAIALIVLFDMRAAASVLRSPVAAWLLFYFVLTTIWAIFTRYSPEMRQELDSRYRSIAFIFMFAALMDDPRARKAAVLSVAVCIVVGAFLNVAETLSFVTFADLPDSERTGGRSAGFYINPNIAGAALAMGLAAIAESLPKPLRAPLLLVAAIGEAATFSRGGMLCLAVVFLWLVYRRALGTWQVALASATIGVCLMYAFSYMEAKDLLNDNTAARLALTKDDSGRVGLLKMAWGQFESSPWLGNGLGSTLVWHSALRPHDMFVNLAADHGVLGLLAFPALGLALYLRNRASAGFALVLMATAFFSHNLLEERWSLLLVALAASQPIQATTPKEPWSGDAGVDQAGEASPES